MHLMDDAALVEAARRGDDAAWAAIYDRYAGQAPRPLPPHPPGPRRGGRRPSTTPSWRRPSNLHQLRDPSGPRPWMYSICRHTSLRRLKARDRAELIDAPDDMSGPDVDPTGASARRSSPSSSGGRRRACNGRDQALLDLHLRQGLEGQDPADAQWGPPSTTPT